MGPAAVDTHLELPMEGGGVCTCTMNIPFSQKKMMNREVFSITISDIQNDKKVRCAWCTASSREERERRDNTLGRLYIFGPGGDVRVKITNSHILISALGCCAGQDLFSSSHRSSFLTERVLLRGWPFWGLLQQHPPDDPPPALPEGMLGFAGECWGPILMPLAWNKVDHIAKARFVGGHPPTWAILLESHNCSIAHLVVDVEHSLLDLVVDLPGRVDERLFDVGGSLGRGLHEYQAVLACKGLALLTLDVAAGLQVTFC